MPMPRLVPLHAGREHDLDDCVPLHAAALHALITANLSRASSVFLFAPSPPCPSSKGDRIFPALKKTENARSEQK